MPPWLGRPELLLLLVPTERQGIAVGGSHPREGALEPARSFELPKVEVFVEVFVEIFVDVSVEGSGRFSACLVDPERGVLGRLGRANGVRAPLVARNVV